MADSRGNVNSNQRQFDEGAIYRVRRAEEIRREMETDLRSAAAIVQLLERVEQLELEGGESSVCASATCKKAFRRAGGDGTLDLLEIACRAMGV